MLISIFASIWCQNLWDELILKNQIDILEKKYPWKNKYIVFSYDKKNPFFKKENVFYKSYFPISIKNPTNIFKNLFSFISFLYFSLKSDLIVIGWGWIIYDNEIQTTKNPLDLWIYRVRFFDIFFKKYIFFRVSIDIKNDENIKKITRIFKNAKEISVRDNQSSELLNSLNIVNSIELDPVFFDNWDFKKNNSLLSYSSSFTFDINTLEKIDFSWKKVWFSFRYGYFFEKSKISNRLEEWKINQIIKYLVSKDAKVILLPHSFHKTDLIANDYLYMEHFLQDWVKIEKTMEDVYEVYTDKDIDICISMRLHSIILCHTYDIPFLWLSYSKKTDETLNFLKW